MSGLSGLSNQARERSFRVPLCAPFPLPELIVFSS